MSDVFVPLFNIVESGKTTTSLTLKYSVVEVNGRQDYCFNGEFIMNEGRSWYIDTSVGQIDCSNITAVQYAVLDPVRNNALIFKACILPYVFSHGP